ncbi:MAG: hypothetical protein GTO33_07420 [Acidobacteria bacterium]|nr:hypothetical protein [Acidobacteriota bacterium]
MGFGIDAAEPGDTLSPRLERHIAACLRCQAQRARTRRTRRELMALSGSTAPAPSGFVTTVSAAIVEDPGDPALPPPAPTHVGAVAVTGAAVLAAGGAAIAAWRLVRRPA